MLQRQQTLRVAIYADQKSRVEFSHPARSEIIADYMRYFGERLDLMPVDADDVRNGRIFLEQPHVFILPGIIGEKSYYPDHIGHEGNQHIRRFVRTGGVYKGYCAGAYYAASHVLYTTADNEIKTRNADENLALTSARAFGPLPGHCRPDPETMQYSPEWHRLDPVVVELDDGTPINMAYGLGPVFNTMGHPDVRVSARYAQIEGKPPAIIDQNYGDGYLTLYGALPQFSAAVDPVFNQQRPSPVRRLEAKLYESRDERTAFADRSMRRLAQHCGLSVS